MNTELYALRERLRHSAAHIMADAVVTLFPDAKLAIGPPTDDGFYYDFQVHRPFTPEDSADLRHLSVCPAVCKLGFAGFLEERTQDGYRGNGSIGESLAFARSS